MFKIGFQETGSGPVILLIHGFPMNRQVWEEFRFLVSANARVVTIDLPGFGESSLTKKTFSLSDIAEEINAWLLERGVTTCIPIGHSLGGYIVLAMAEKNPEQFAGMGLFHSTAYADSTEKKESRSKVVEFVKKNGVLAFTSNFIPPLFSNQSHHAVETVRSIAIQADADAVLGYTCAMRDRPTRTEVIEHFSKPVLFIGGENDGGIAPETILVQAELNSHSETHILKDVAHMGMFENPAVCAAVIREFAERCHH